MTCERHVRLGFDIDRFVEACRAARRAKDAAETIAKLLGEAIADPAAIFEAVAARRGDERAAEMAEVFVNDEDLTIYQVSFPANLFGVPHDHAGWAVIGVYSGTEAFNTYEERDGRLALTGRTVLRAPAVKILEPDLIHDIDNPGETISGSIHVYDNRHFDMPSRRIWRDGNAQCEPFTLERSFQYGMERTTRKRRELGLPDIVSPSIPDLESVRSKLGEQR